MAVVMPDPAQLVRPNTNPTESTVVLGPNTVAAANLSEGAAGEVVPSQSQSVANPDVTQLEAKIVAPASPALKLFSPAEIAALKQQQEGLRAQTKNYLTVQLQKGQVTAEKAREVALAAKTEIESAQTVTECGEVIQHLAVKFPETLDGLVVAQEESASRGAELEIASIVVHWLKEGRVDWAISLAKEAADRKSVV